MIRPIRRCHRDGHCTMRYEKRKPLHSSCPPSNNGTGSLRKHHVELLPKCHSRVSVLKPGSTASFEQPRQTTHLINLSPHAQLTPASHEDESRCTTPTHCRS
jgi:hypothetical protein